VCAKLDKKLRDNLRDARNSLLSDGTAATEMYSFHRPVLILMDRASDRIGQSECGHWTVCYRQAASEDDA